MTDTNLTDELGRYRSEGPVARSDARAARRSGPVELEPWEPTDALGDPVDAQLLAAHVGRIAREVAGLARQRNNPSRYRDNTPGWRWLDWPAAFPALELQATAAILSAHARRLAGADLNGVTATGHRPGVGSPFVALEVGDTWLNLRGAPDGKVAVTTGPASLPVHATTDELRGIAAWLEAIADGIDAAR